MPAVLVSKIIPYGTALFVELNSNIIGKYKHIFENLKDEKIYVVTYLYGVYNENGEIVKEYRKFYKMPIRKIQYYVNYILFIQKFYIDISDLVADGIPAGHILIQVLFALQIEKASDATSIKIPILPGECPLYYSLDIPNSAFTRINHEVGSLSRSREELEIVFNLFEIGLENIASDLMEGLKRFNASDYEGAIKFFRKVVEGFRELLKRNELKAVGLGNRRQELLTEFLSKTFSLLSNFGEHAGTQGSIDEAKFSKEIVFAISRYIASYLTREEVRKAISELKGVAMTEKQGAQWVSLP